MARSLYVKFFGDDDLRIYLDNCCFGRPFDNQNFPRIAEETAAQIFIENLIRAGKVELATSYMLHYENLQCPRKQRREHVAQFLKSHTSNYVSVSLAERVMSKAEKFISAGIKQKDAYHLASAILAECDYFLSVDDRLLKCSSDDITL
ncbi:MAG: hypothetical protein IJP68_07395, partial [Selenomonadaceae bacterium]|nr:hypothetical protein [Selenomonadaceae bacterium]